MPKWISRSGKWYPQNEKVGLINKQGEPYIYDGADRAALFVLWQDKVETLGMDFKIDPELLMRVKQLGFKDMAEYLAYIGYDEKKVEEQFKKNASVVNMHELPAKIQAIEKMGGGVDTSGQGGDILGGFGKPKDIT